MVERSPVQTAALLVGVVFLLVGVLGFVPGITTDFDELRFAGPDSEAKLLGLFQVSILHNLVHLGFGLAGLAFARSWEGARAYLIGGGAIYLVLAAYGFVIDRDADENFVPVNMADNWLHIGLGVGMVLLGTLVDRRRVDTR